MQLIPDNNVIEQAKFQSAITNAIKNAVFKKTADLGIVSEQQDIDAFNADTGLDYTENLEDLFYE